MSSAKALTTKQGFIAGALIFAIIAFATLIGINQYAKHSQELLIKAETDKNRFEKIFQDVSKTKLEALSLATQILAQNEEILSLFEHKNRAGLAAKTVPFYTTILHPRFNIAQFDFFTPPATTFFRAHQPEHFGDDHSAVRKMLLKAHKDRIPTLGLEMGASGPGLRSVVPIIRNEELIGSVELGGDIAEPLNAAQAASGLDYAFAIDRTLCESLGKFFNADKDVLVGQQLFFRFSTPAAITTLRALTFDPLATQPQMVTKDNRTVFVGTIPVHEFSGAEIGRIALLRDATDELASARLKIITMTTLSALVLLLLTVFGVYQFHRIQDSFESSILSSRRELKEKADAYNALASRMKELSLWKRGFLTAVCSALHLPLGGAIGIIRGIVKDMEYEETQGAVPKNTVMERLGFVTVELDQLMRALTDYCDIIAINEGLTRFEAEEVSLGGILQSVFHPRDGAFSLPVTLRISNDLPKVRIDPPSITKAFQQILAFVQCQAIPGSLELSAEISGNGTLLGMIRGESLAAPKDAVRFIFEETDQFMMRLGIQSEARLPKGASHLALAARLFEHNGGKLELTSTTDKGIPGLRFVLPLGER
ncbi:MAG: hypothetical protein EPN21_00175 [Methylococcaceae bacterium]|nr:MAG: hypothetical protein EPN21_00175 [Methylococcaceae bacterium]